MRSSSPSCPDTRSAAPVEVSSRRILVIDDDPLILELVAGLLQDKDFEVCAAGDAQVALKLVAETRPHLVLLDLVMPGVSGMELLERILSIDPGIDVILMTAHYSTESAVEAIQRGAYDYLTKPVPVERLRQKVDKWLCDAQERHRTLKLDTELLQTCQLEGLVGRSPLILEVFSRLRRISPHYQTALVAGDTGTGKELAARALHALSPVSSGAFVVCNCAAIVETLFESELFGYTRGAFTGAMQDKQGLVEYANGGTLFLDEIGEMPLATQAKLLRVIQNREVQRLGSPVVRNVDIRIVAATNRNLRDMVAARQFREDLYYRLAMVEIKLPRLADRREDLPLLQRHFLSLFAARYGRPAFHLTRRAQAVLSRYSWPGNVRELQNVLGYSCMMTDTDLIDLNELPEWLVAEAHSAPAPEADEMVTLDELQRRYAARVLQRVGGNRVRAAEVLGISRATLYRLIPTRPAESEG
ncbi:MAG: sigma-54-dependent transcriptional regulator [Bryobacteraceae bacterium]